MAKTLREDKAVRAYAAPALEKGFDILELLADQEGGLTISEIAQRLGRSIGEVFRIIVVMERRQWLRKDATGDRYRVSYRMLDVALRATPAQMLIKAAAPVMVDLANNTNQSCHLVIRAESRGIVTHRQESPAPVGLGIRLGTVVDLGSSCSGHVLLAFATDEVRTSVIKDLSTLSKASRTSLLKRLDEVRAAGFEMQPSARTQGVTDISYPVFTFDKRIAAALTIPFLLTIDGSQLTDVQATRAHLADAAAHISRELGWLPSPE